MNQTVDCLNSLKLYLLTERFLKFLLIVCLLLGNLSLALCHGSMTVRDTTWITQLNHSADLLSTSRPDSTIALAKESLKLSRELKFTNGIAASLKILAEAHHQLKQYDLSTYFYELYTVKNDSMQQEGQDRMVAKVKAAHQYALRESELNNLQLLKQEAFQSQIFSKQIAQSKLSITIFFVGILLLIVILFMILSTRKNQSLTRQQEALEGIIAKQKTIIEEKTHEVLAGKKTISYYSFLNSHELRAPLAKILSIVYLFDQVNTQRGFLFESLKKSTGELEEAVEKIINELPNELEG